MASPLNFKYGIRKREFSNVPWNHTQDLRSQNKIWLPAFTAEFIFAKRKLFTN